MTRPELRVPLMLELLHWGMDIRDIDMAMRESFGLSNFGAANFLA